VDLDFSGRFIPDKNRIPMPGKRGDILQEGIALAPGMWRAMDPDALISKDKFAGQCASYIFHRPGRDPEGDYTQEQNLG
jgi:hypothetical protein